MIRFYYGIDPENLTDEKWAQYIGEWKYVQEINNRQAQNNFRIVLNEALIALFGKK